MQTQQFQDAMTEATRLTRTGRLADATALIQRTLGQPGDGVVDNRAPSPPASATLPHRGTRQRRVRVRVARGHRGSSQKRRSTTRRARRVARR